MKYLEIFEKQTRENEGYWLSRTSHGQCRHQKSARGRWCRLREIELTCLKIDKFISIRLLILNIDKRTALSNDVAMIETIELCSKTIIKKKKSRKINKNRQKLSYLGRFGYISNTFTTDIFDSELKKISATYNDFCNNSNDGPASSSQRSRSFIKDFKYRFELSIKREKISS